MNNGLWSEIVAYRGARDLDVRFDCGGITKHMHYANFKCGKAYAPVRVEINEKCATVINPNAGFEFVMDAEDISLLGNATWSKCAGYAYNNDLGYLHRLVMRAPDGVEVDHLSMDKLDVRKSNLRLCTHAENNRNKDKPISNTSGYKGVYWHNANKRWVARIRAKGKTYSLGCYDTAEQAANAYDAAAVEHHREFARLNFSEGVRLSG